MIAIAFALPEESREVVAALRAPRRSGSRTLPVITGWLKMREVAVFHTGIGPVSAREQLRQFWDNHCGGGVDYVIGSGFAGGLDPALPAGTLVLAANYPERLDWARLFLDESAQIGPLASADAVLETPQAKAAFACKTGALAVDMESETVAEFFRKKGVPFLALRAISDAVHEPLPVPSAVWFDASAQCPRPLALIGYLLRHRARIRPFVRFWFTIRRARRMLSAALVHLVNNSRAGACPALRPQ